MYEGAHLSWHVHLIGRIRYMIWEIKIVTAHSALVYSINNLKYTHNTKTCILCILL